MIGDSVAAGLLYAPSAVRRLGAGMDLRLDLKVCRRLVAPSCRYGGTTPLTVLQAVQARGTALGGTVVVDVGYNDDPRAYGRDLDRVLGALRSARVRCVVWVTPTEKRSAYRTTNAAIRAAARRWPRIRVADWNAASAGRPWFSSRDGLHLNAAGAAGLASFLRRQVLSCPVAQPRRGAATPAAVWATLAGRPS
jgi:hypothetical protein